MTPDLVRSLIALALTAIPGSGVAQTTIAIASDSIAVQYPDVYFVPVQGWGAFVPVHLGPGFVWQNAAVGGASTESFIELGYWADVIASQPDVILIQFGANDVRSAPEVHTDPDTTYRENLHQMIVDARAIGAEPVLLTPFCFRYAAADGLHVLRPGHLEPYAAAMRAQAAADEVGILSLIHI